MVFLYCINTKTLLENYIMKNNELLIRNRVSLYLRQLASRYSSSNKVHDVEQGKTLMAIADDIASNNDLDALVRFDALHANIKKSMPFEVIDLLNKAELMLDAHR